MSALEEFSIAATRNYLQSVVFVDDRIFDVRSGMPVQPIELPRPRKPIFQRVPEGNAVQVPPDNNAEAAAEQAYHPKELVSSFAREGIICALYEPPIEFFTDPTSEIFRICERPDIIILDWDFSGDNGRRVLDLISALVTQSEKALPHHIRLLAIYTADPSLVAVANKISDRLREDGFVAEPHLSQCRLQAGATRLLVFGKGEPRFGTDEEQFTVKESELATRLIQEFADMNAGILPSYALHGMAAIRRNSKRILERFHGQMDGAFLLHRLLSRGSEEAFDQLPALLAEELLAVLEAERLASDKTTAIANEAASTMQFSPPRKDWMDLSGKKIASTALVASEVLKDLLLSGALDLAKYKSVAHAVNIVNYGFKGIDPDLMADFLAMVDTANLAANERLASLFSTRTQYETNTRMLSYGTIVRQLQIETDNQYWIYSFCLMPVCDSIRLDQSTQGRKGQAIRFPFWRLRENVFSNSEAARRGLAVNTPDAVHVSLSAGGKSRDMLWLAGFKADPMSGMVLAIRNQRERFVFLTDTNEEIEWVGQLKPLHAQRIAHDIALGLSRVGLLEAEWLRLLCDR